MFNTQRTSNKQRSNSRLSASRHGVYTLIFGTSIVIASVTLVGCGQKGNLYLVDASSKAVQDSTAILDSGSNPQDTAFAKIDGDQKNTEDFQLPEPSNDPNDY
ncbi:LptM family lipoprotein [Psychrobacter arcticus]|nr:lipoprotein [Psychrobacter arcticus]